MKTIVLLVAIAACSRHDGVRVGSVFESETVTRLQQPFEHETTSTIKETVVATSDSDVSVRVELSNGSVQVVQMPRERAAPEPCPGTTVATTHEVCTTPAGTFECTRTTVEARHASSVTWTAKDIPVPIMSIVKNDNLTTTTELVSLRP